VLNNEHIVMSGLAEHGSVMQGYLPLLHGMMLGLAESFLTRITRDRNTNSSEYQACA
jgi:hypothetical protein